MEARQCTPRLPRLSLLAGALVLTAALLPQHAFADELTFDINQVGANVVVTGSGSVDTNALILDGTTFLGAYTVPTQALIGVGTATTLDAESVSGFSGPSTIGTSSAHETADTDTGDTFAFIGAHGKLYLPLGYVSGADLDGTATWDNTTIGSLGLTPGVYTWTYGSNSEDSVVVDVAPEPSTWLLLATGFALLAAFGRRRFALN